MVPTILPDGAETAMVVFGAVRSTTPFVPGSVKPVVELTLSNVQVFGAAQPYRF